MRKSRVALAASLAIFASSLNLAEPVVAEAVPSVESQAVEAGPSVQVDPGSPSDPERVTASPDPLTDPADLVELEEERTASSRTYALPDGTNQTVLTAAPINYETADGSFEEIDASWVRPEGRGTGGWTNAANSFDVTLPSTLASPVVASGNGASVRFELADAGTGTDLAKATGALDDEGVVRYDAGGGVSVRYTGTTTGVKEDVVLASPDAPRRFVFDVDADGGELRLTEHGSVEVVGPDGSTLLHVPAPLAIDAKGNEGPARFELAEGKEGQRLTLVGDDRWLADPARAWPVAIDPTVEFGGPTESEDCYISSQNPTLQDCSATTLRTGYEAPNRRTSLLDFPDIYLTIPRNAERVTAFLRLTAVSHSNPSGQVNLRMRRVTKDWSNTVNWNTTNGSTPWATPGGDFDTTTPEYNDVPNVTKNIGGTTTGSFLLYAHEIVNDWLADPSQAFGLAITADTATSNDTVNLRSAQHTTVTEQPALIVRWHYREGMRDQSSFESFTTTDRSNVNVNYASLNGVVAANEFDIQGTGQNLNVTRYYNTRNDDSRRWTWSIGADTWLEELGDGSMIYHQADGGEFLFVKKASTGTYYQPPGANGKLTRTNANDYTLTFNSSQLKLRFQKNGNILVPYRSTDRNGNFIEYDYTVNGAGYPEIDTVTDTQGRVMDVTWTSGRITSITDWTSRSVSYTWTGAVLTTARDAGNADTTYGYDGQDRLQTITTPEGRLLTIVYSTVSDRIVKIQRKLDGSTTYEWTFSLSLGTQESTVTDPNGNATNYLWTYREKIAKVTDALFHATERDFNKNDDATELRTAVAGGVYKYNYSTDGNNNLQEIQSPSTGTGSPYLSTSFQYNTATGPSGAPYLPSSTIDPQGSCRAFGYDGNGNINRTYDGATVSSGSCSSSGGGATTEINRNGNGTVANVKDPNGNITYYSYDVKGNLTGINYPSSMGDWTYDLDGLSRPETVVDGNSDATGFTYDALDRITRITYDGDTGCTSPATCTTFVYDDDGNLVSRTDNTGTTSFTYDGLGRARTKELPGGANACSTGGSAMTLDYDGRGNLTKYCDAQGVVTYSFDDADRMTGLAEPGGSCVTPKSHCVTYTYNADNQLKFINYPTSPVFQVEYQYTPGGADLSRIIGKQGAVAKVDVEYTYTNSGGQDTSLVHTRTDNMQPGSNIRTYKYDNRDRLCWTRVSTSTSTSNACGSQPGGSVGYSYDANGNRTQVNSGGTITNYAYNNTNGLCWFGSATAACGNSGGTSFTYDGNGANVGRSDGFASAYNAKQQTSSVTFPGGTPKAMAYSDVDSTERTSFDGTTFDNGPLGLARSTTGSYTKTWTRTNDGMLVSQHGTDPAYSTARHYYVLDRQGSVMALVAPDGSVANQYNYTPFGSPTASTTFENGPRNPFRFHGGYRDNDQSIKFGTRYYDPTLGRFIQVDPLPGSVSDPGTANRYHYAHNDAVNRSDQSGYWSISGEVCAYHVCLGGTVGTDEDGDIHGGPTAGVSTQSGGAGFSVDDDDLEEGASVGASCSLGPVNVDTTGNVSVSPGADATSAGCSAHAGYVF